MPGHIRTEAKLIAEHKAECAHYLNGQCSTLACMERQCANDLGTDGCYKFVGCLSYQTVKLLEPPAVPPIGCGDEVERLGQLIDIWDRVHDELDAGKKWPDINSGLTDAPTYAFWSGYVQQGIINATRTILRAQRKASAVSEPVSSDEVTLGSFEPYSQADGDERNKHLSQPLPVTEEELARVPANDDPKAMADAQIEVIDRMADAWAEEVDLATMIKNATSPMDLKPHAPAEVRAVFRQRMEDQIDAIARQCFLEGASRAVCLVQDAYRQAPTSPRLTQPLAGEGWRFDRYVHGELMAEGGHITKAQTFKEAALAIARLFADSPGSVFVLAAVPQAPAGEDSIHADGLQSATVEKVTQPE